MKITDLGNPNKPNDNDRIDNEINDPRDDALTILIKSDKLVYRHIPLYKPKTKNENNFDDKTMGRYLGKLLNKSFGK